MFHKIGQFSVKYRYLVISTWVLLALLMFFFAPSLAEVGKVTEATFLPKDSESLYARQLVKKYFPDSASTSSVGIVFFRDGGLNESDMEYARRVNEWLLSGKTSFKVESVTSVFDSPQLSSQLISPDKTTMIVNVGLAESALESESTGIVEEIRNYVKQHGGGLEIYVSGQVGVYSDLFDAINKSIDLTTLVTIILLIILLIVIYRSPVAIFVPLITIGIAFLVSRGVIGLIAQAGVSIWSQIDIFLIVLVFGVGTDYCLFMISRFREEITHPQSRREAMVTTVTRIGAVITASAFAVIVGLVGMYVAKYEVIRTMGPVLGVAIFVTLLAALTLTPAITSVFGKKLFWPLHEKLVNNENRKNENKTGFWARIAHIATGKPYIVIPVVLVIMLVPLAALPDCNRSFNQLSELPSDSEAVAGFRVLEEHFNIGEMEPLVGIVRAKDGVRLSEPAYLATIAQIGNEIKNVEGVAKVQTVVQLEGTSIKDEFTVSGQLSSISRSLEDSILRSSSNPSISSLQSDLNSSLENLERYLQELTVYYPEVKNETAYVNLRNEINSIKLDLADLQSNMLVENQLSMLSEQLNQVTSAIKNPPTQSSFSPDILQRLTPVGDYLSGLAIAYPDVQTCAGFQTAYNSLVSISQSVSQAGNLPSEQMQALISSIVAHLQNISEGLDETREYFAGTGRVFLANSFISEDYSSNCNQKLLNLKENIVSLKDYFDNKGNDFFLPETLMSSNEEAKSLFRLFFDDTHQVSRFYVILDCYPQSDAAIKAVNEIRQKISSVVTGTSLEDAEIVIGGPSAEMADVKTILDRDFNAVIPVVIIAVFVVLVVLLRSLLAPIYLLLTVLLSYGTTLGIVTWIFQGIMGQEGISFLLPIIIFALLVALGSDYNMFLMSRVREESIENDGREAARLASVATGAVITACGIILAGTFVVLVITPIRTMVQIGTAVAIGVMIDTFIVRALLVPSIASVLKRWNWWPAKLK